jgi:hypothetical protein
LFAASAIVILFGVAAGNIGAAQAALLTEEEHWKYNVHWAWKPSLRKTIGIINSQIIIENETADRIQGYIADSNGTRLEMYNSEQVVMVKYQGKWSVGPRTSDGFFTVEIPERYRDVETIGLFVGSNSYHVDTGTFPVPLVLINSARLDYTTDPTLGTEQTTTIAQETPQRFSDDSLIDRILRLFSSSSSV